jgi:hypothetical protein
LRDRFAIDSYASYIASWTVAGYDVEHVIKASDRVFLMQGMVTGSLTDGYMIDQFYFPASKSRYEDLRACYSQAHNGYNCTILYDYWITFAGATHRPPAFEVWKEYDTIAVLKRKSFPIPDTPTDLKAVRITPDTMDVSWISPVGEFESHIEVEQGTRTRSFTIPPDYRIFRIPQMTGEEAKVRNRSCNDKGCSPWSTPVAVK